MTSALSIRNLHKVYDSGFVALKGIDLEVQPGDFFHYWDQMVQGSPPR